MYAISSIRKILSKNSFNEKILISNIHYANVLSLIFFSKIENLKIIVNERTAIKELDIYFGIFDFFKKKIIKMLIIFFYKRSSQVITNSSKCSKDLENIINFKVQTIFSPSYLVKKIKKKVKKISKKFFWLFQDLLKKKIYFF